MNLGKFSIKLFFIMILALVSCSQNIIYKYSHYSNEKLEILLNKKFDGDFILKISDKGISINNQEGQSFFIDYGCVGAYSFSYNPNMDVIFYTPEFDCNSFPNEIDGIVKISNRYYINLLARENCMREYKKVVKTVDLLNNIVFKNKR